MLEMVITARAADLGHGLKVRRVLPYAKRRMVGPFVFFDHAGPVTLPPEAVRAVQLALQELGFYAGPVDGVFGQLTYEAAVAAVRAALA